MQVMKKTCAQDISVSGEAVVYKITLDESFIF